MDIDAEFKISESDREEAVKGEERDFPKYSTQLLNIATQNSQANRPKHVGSLSDLFDDFREEYPNGTYEDWRTYYLEHHDGEGRLDNATERLVSMVENFREVLEEDVDEALAREYLDDLVVYQTYKGFGIEEAIAKELGERTGCQYSITGSELEASDVDFIINNQPVSVKPVTHKDKHGIPDIDIPTVYYEEYDSVDSLDVDISELLEHGVFDDDGSNRTVRT